MNQNISSMSVLEAFAIGAMATKDGQTMSTLRSLVPVRRIADKPVPRWPDRRSYRAQARAAAKRRNIAKGGRR